jgi:hypothetical protein
MTTARRAWRDREHERDRMAAEWTKPFRQQREGMMANDNELRRLTGLWQTDKDGKRYLSGTIGEKFILEPGCKILVFEAKQQRTDKSPTHFICVAPPEAKRDSGSF